MKIKFNVYQNQIFGTGIQNNTYYDTNCITDGNISFWYTIREQ